MSIGIKAEHAQISLKPCLSGEMIFSTDEILCDIKNHQFLIFNYLSVYDISFLQEVTTFHNFLLEYGICLLMSS